MHDMGSNTVPAILTRKGIKENLNRLYEWAIAGLFFIYFGLLKRVHSLTTNG